MSMAAAMVPTAVVSTAMSTAMVSTAVAPTAMVVAMVATVMAPTVIPTITADTTVPTGQSPGGADAGYDIPSRPPLTPDRGYH